MSSHAPLFRVRSAIVIGLTACVAPIGLLAEDLPRGTSDGCPADYVIGPEDVLDIAVWDNAAVSRTVPVRPDGKISLPLLNDVIAAGLTPMQLRDAFRNGFVEYMPAASVSVLVREIHSFKVSVIGHVKTPGRYEIKDRATVLDVLAIAGGLTEFASRSRIVVLRQDNAAARHLPFAYDRLVAAQAAKNGGDSHRNGAADGHRNFCVRPGDVIVVP